MKSIVIRNKDIYLKSKTSGKIYFNVEAAIAALLMDNTLFCSPNGRTLTLYVLCNDVFSWGTADAEPIQEDKVQELFEMIEKDNQYGAVKWLMKKRKMRPQEPLIEQMKKAGKWDDNIVKKKNK